MEDMFEKVKFDGWRRRGGQGWRIWSKEDNSETNQPETKPLKP
jgi:hypothetical protein